MDVRTMDTNTIMRFGEYLTYEEKSNATVEKYLRDVRRFFAFASGREVSKELVKSWKEDLIERGYAPRSINSMLASLNSILSFLGWGDCRVKNLKTQHQAYCPEEKVLSKEEYIRLVNAADGKPQLRLIIESICASGIRVSELKFFTVEMVKRGQVEIFCKGKIRTILLQKKLKKRLLLFAKRNGIKSGVIFLNRAGRPLSRSSIWAKMKRLCKAASVSAGKVFPHNLRKLFARTFYKSKRDIAKLADILGHNSIDTTRIYLITSGAEHRYQLEHLGLLI